MNLYWVSAIVQSKFDQKPSLLAMSEGEISLEKAMEVVGRIKENETVLSVWVDLFDEGNKRVVFHECYLDAFGGIWPAEEG